MFEAYIILLSVCFASFLINRKKILYYISPLGWLVGYALISELAGHYLDDQQLFDNPRQHLYQLVELWLLCLTYYWYYQSEKADRLRRMVPVLLAVFTLLYVFISFYVEGIYNDCIINFLITSVLMITLSTKFFYKLYIESTEINVLSFGFFWINAGNLLYASGTFFQMGLYTYVKSFNPVLAEDFMIINHVLNYFLYANYMAAFLCTKKFLYS